jgi:asparagine synthase (glutamine-hydrolysing)
MCGIAGFAAEVLPKDALDVVQRMTDSLARRGPDAEGVHCWPSAVLGHRRLSIFDLSDAGRQPMLSPDGQVGVVFNGAIYNFVELREELVRKGYRFQSQTDTEVLVHGYDAWGIDALVPKLRGMFAFALWDNRLGSLTLVRDRLGVKPLVFAQKNKGIAFASTVQALQRAGFVEDIDDAAVLDFVEFGWIPDGRSIFKGAVKLPAATIAEWRNGTLTQRKYWSVPPAGAAGSISFNEAVEATEAALVEAVRLRLFADVPVGALLSGGIDSTLVCWAMAKLNANITAFTISTPGDPADEGDDARRTAQLLGISHEVIELPPTGETSVDELVSAYGEPFASSSALGMLRVSKAVKPKVTVLLTGDGGDDIFLGYPRHRHMWWAQRTARMLPGPVAAMWPNVRKAVIRAPRLRRPMHFLDYATEGLSAASMNADLLGYYERRGMLGGRLGGIRRPPVKSSLASARQLLPEFLDHEWQTQFTGEYMTKVDGATMYYAVEARSPFLDHVLWELAGALPYGVRLHRSELKAVLREIVRRRVHPEVAARRKKGFEIPVENWLLTQSRAQLDEIRDSTVLEQEGWTNPGSIGRAIDEARERQAVPTQLWRLIILEQWMRKRTPVLARA